MKFSRRALLKTVSVIALAASAGGWIHGSSLHTGALYNVTDPITTAQGELVFTVWRKYFFEAGLVTYTIGGGTAVNGVDYDGSLSPLSGTLNFAAFDVCQHVRIQTFGTGGASNKPASGAAQVTLNLTLTGSTNGQIEDAVGNGTIQSGVVYYFSATGNNANAGTEAAPFAYLGSNGVQAKISAMAAGTLLRLKRGDTWTLSNAATSTFSIVANVGGTVANPAIIGAYGTGADPIINADATYSTLAYLIAIGGSSSGSNDTSVIIEDLTLEPGTLPAVNRDFIRLGTGTVNPKNRTVQRLTLQNPNNFLMNTGINGSSANFITNFTVQFCDISHCNIGFLLTGTNVTVLGNHIHDCGHEPVRQWGIYSGHCVDVYIYANKLIDNIQSIKQRSGTNTNWRWNYCDNSAICKVATVTAATVAAQCVFTIGSSTIPAKRLRVGDYFTVGGFAGTGWTSKNGTFVTITEVISPTEYKTDWDTSTYGAFSGGTPVVYSGGNLNVGFGYDTVVSAADAENLNCTYESNVQIGNQGFGFGVAEGGTPAWEQGVINFVARNNLVLVNSINPLGVSTGFPLNFNSPYMNGVYIYNNTFVLDGFDYAMLFMPFTQTTGGNVGPIGPVVLKNNLFKRINVAGATQFLAYYGASSIPGATVLGLITQDYNLWNDSTASKFASVNSGSTYTTLANFNAAFPSQEAHGVTTSVTLGPYLGVGDFLPPNGSATYGASQAGLVSNDFIGNPRASIPTIGAIEVAA